MADSKTYAAIGGLSAIVGGGAAVLGALSNAIGSDIQGQKENVERFCQMIQKACKN